MRLVIIAIFTLCSLNSLAQANWRDKMNLKGKVKAIKLTEYQIDGTDIRKANFLLSYSGNLLEEVIFNDKGNQLYKQSLEYKNNLLVSEKIENKQLKDSSFNKTYNYKSGKLVGVKVNSNQKELLSRKHEYPTDSTEVLYTFSNKILESKITNTYNSEKFLKEELIETTELKKVLYFYDDNKLIAKKEYEQNVFVFQVDYKYDNHKNVISEKSKYKNSDKEELFEYKYEYDDKGNWVYMQEIMNGRTYAITIRDIEYFK